MSAPRINTISDEDRERWERHNLEDLLCWADVPLTRKVQMLEEMEEVARAFHGGRLPCSPDEHNAAPNSI